MLWVSTVPGRIIITPEGIEGHTYVVQIVWGARMELECPCVIRRTALSRCLSFRFKCPVMKSTEPPAPGFSLSLFSTWQASPSSRQQISSPNHLKPKRLVCGSCFIPLRSACCRHVCQLQHVASGSSHMQHAATGIRATWAADCDWHGKLKMFNIAWSYGKHILKVNLKCWLLNPTLT